MFTEETLKKALPQTLKQRVSPELLEAINKRIRPEIAEMVEDNAITFSWVLQDGRYKFEYYLEVITFCSYKLIGDTNKDAWRKTFPDRYSKLLKEGKTEKDIASHISGFANRKLITDILAQALVPAHLLNAHHYQEGINKLVNLMRTAGSERIQMESASKLLDALKPPEVKKIELDVSAQSTDLIEALRHETARLAATQKRLIEDGIYTAKDAAHQRIIEG